ncbi:MAG: hypothetical protein VB949_12515 [Pseudomonadales bacterium]
MSKDEFEKIFQRIKTAEIEYGATFDSVGSNTDLAWYRAREATRQRCI